MRIYFVGICGTAMGNVARLAAEAGHTVAGSDRNVYPPMSDVLARAGISIDSGFDAERLAGWRPEQVVVGNATSRGNPEVEWLLRRRGNPPYDSLPGFVAEHLLAGRQPVVVAGTHGKTTTTSLLAWLLRERNHDPGWLIGGDPLDLPAGAAAGATGAPFVIEGDEYDSAFFDKRSKFIHYRPALLLLNNLEFDHADIFRDLTDVRRTFDHLLRTVPDDATVLANGDDPELESLLNRPWLRVVRVGCHPRNDFRILGFREDADGATFRLSHSGHGETTVTWRHPGLHNARNASMALAALAILETGTSGSAGQAAPPSSLLEHFRGVRRRRETHFSSPRLRIIEDFGHHPTAIGSTLTSLRAQFPEAELIACVEPRSNSMRLRIFADALVSALSAADRVILGRVHRADDLAEAVRLDPPALAQRLRALHNDDPDAAVAVDRNDEIVTRLRQRWRADDERPRVVVLFTNGSFDGILPRTVSAACEDFASV